MSTPPGNRHSRGPLIAIVVLSLVVVVLIGVIVSMMVADGTKISPTPEPIYTPTTPPPATPSGSAGPTSTSTAGGTPECSTADLTVSLGSPSGAAGSTYLPIRFTNSSSSPCTLHGFPGVSFVGKGNGTQIGAAADWNTSATIVQNTLQPGSTVVASLQIAEADNYASSQCQPLKPDGFRIYPPHSTASVFVADTSFTACQSSSVHLLRVTSPVAPAS